MGAAGEAGARMPRGVKAVGGGRCEGDDEAPTVLRPVPVRLEREKEKKRKNVASYLRLRDIREGKGRESCIIASLRHRGGRVVVSS